MTNTDTAIPTIALNRLLPFTGNVRKVQNKPFIDELAASIKAHGLQQNLIVKKDGRKFAVVAGGQRLKALQQLAKSGDIPPDYPVMCKVAGGDLDPIEISLLENAVRDDMHPADLFEAFRALVDKGASVADIAARFGRTEQSIRQLLKLARVSPRLLKAYRENKLSLEQVMAFAISDDHAEQERVFASLRSHNNSPRSIRAALTVDELPATDRRVKFVGIEAYREAGGKLREDLFSEGAESVYILDTALLMGLAAAKLERAAQRVAKESWKWTEFHIDFGYEEKSGFRNIYAEPAPLPPKLAEKAERLQAELDVLREAWHAEENEDAKQPARIGKLEQKLEAIEAGRGEPVWTPEQLAMAGAVVTIGTDGKTEILRGLVRPEDMPKKQTKKADTAAAEGELEQSTALSSALVEDLTAQRSAALAAALSDQPDIALASVVHALAARIFLQSSEAETALEIAASKQSLHRVEGSKALATIDAERETWSRKLPASPEELWTWCLKQKQDVLLELLAFCAASTVNAVRTKGERPDCARLQYAEMLAVAVGLDMKEWFTPDAKNYFSRVDKPQILEALQEGRSQPPAPAWEKLKKGELAALAERELAGKAWLPSLLRPAA